MTVVDWRKVDARALALVFARERARWLVDLGWETRDSWLQVEQARTTWGLPGLAAVDDSGRVRGLTFFHATGTRFDIGGVFAESEGLRQSLLDAAVRVCEDAGGADVNAFLYAGGTSTAEELASRGFVVEAFDYLTCTLAAAAARRSANLGETIVLRDWRTDEVSDLGALLAASYEPPAARRFVGESGGPGWEQYVGNLARHAACGVVLPELTRLAYERGALIGAVLVTSLGPATTHIAQLVVHPRNRRKGLAGALLDESARLSRLAGYARTTLLVSAANGPAQDLYRERGYIPTAAFLSATKELDRHKSARAS